MNGDESVANQGIEQGLTRMSVKSVAKNTQKTVNKKINEMMTVGIKYDSSLPLAVKQHYGMQALYKWQMTGTAPYQIEAEFRTEYDMKHVNTSLIFVNYWIKFQMMLND